MLAKVTKLARYKVKVLSLRPRRDRNVAEDHVFINDHDTFFGYGYKNHRTGKYFDLWFANPKEKDQDNFVTFGRIKKIWGNPQIPGFVYATKLGMFYVVEMK